MPKRSSNAGETPAATSGVGNRAGKPHKKGKHIQVGNEIAFALVQQAMQEPDALQHEPEVTRLAKDPAAVALGSLGGLKGKTPTEKPTPEERTEIARQTAQKR